MAAIVYTLSIIALLLFCYLGIYQVYQAVNNNVITCIKLMLGACGATGDRITMPGDSPLITYLRSLLSRWQRYENTDNGYMITLISQKN